MNKPIIEVDISSIVPRYRPKVIVFHNHNYLTSNYTSEFFEETTVWACCFDTTPQRYISNMKDYGELLREFPNGYRILSRSIYIGNFEERDWGNVMDQILTCWFGEDFELCDYEEEYTRYG